MAKLIKSKGKFCEMDTFVIEEKEVILKEEPTQWDIVLQPKSHLLETNFKEIWRYRDLLSMFVKRDIVTIYKQTILGPIWFVVQPIMTVAVYIFIFGRVAGLSTDGLPMLLFYLTGVVAWSYFAETFNSTAKTFTENQDIFGKVYFPRLIMPISKVTSGLIKFFIQFCLFLLAFGWYYINGYDVQPNRYILLVPVFVLLMAGLGLGFGLIFSSLTTKYRDFTFLLQFGVQLLMYATPVIYPLSSVDGKFRSVLMLNPLTPIIEGFRFAFLGNGTFYWSNLLYTTIFTAGILLIGIFVFNKVEKSFMDTV